MLAWPALLVLASCGESEPPCVADLSLECQPLFDPPTFQALYDNTLNPTCSAGMGTCHSADNAPRGLIFEDPDQSYALLLGADGGRARVIPGDPSCSLVIKRLMSSDPDYRMPPGTDPLPDAEICTFVKWIAQGAPR